MRNEINHQVTAMVLRTKRLKHLDPRYKKLLTKADLDEGVMTATVEDLFWSVNRELGMNNPRTRTKRRAA